MEKDDDPFDAVLQSPELLKLIFEDLGLLGTAAQSSGRSCFECNMSALHTFYTTPQGVSFRSIPTEESRDTLTASYFPRVWQ